MVTTDGFVRLPNWLIDDSSLSLHEMAVYTVLLRFRDHKTGKCYPGMATIADCARVSRETVKRTIPLLEDKGMVRVTRRREGTKNLPNVYEVALAAENPEFVWEKSQRGQRIPKRSRGRHSETLPAEVDDEGRHSETLPRHSETPRVGTRSASNKTYKNKNQEQAVTPTFSESGSDQFTFDASGDDGATENQVAYLKDLAIHLGYESGGGVPDDLQVQRWRKLTRDEADTRIRGYLKALGRPDEIVYPQAGDPAFQALSTKGKHFAQSAGDPASVTEKRVGAGNPYP